MRAWDEELDFRELARADAEVVGRVDLERVFALEAYTAHVDTVFDRLRPLVAARRPSSMPEAVHVGSGKVRELYALGDDGLLLVATDRISTFDVVLPTEIPDKGRVLTGLSAFWFARTRHIVGTTSSPCAPTAARSSAGGSRCSPSRSSSAATSPAPGWVDYRETGAICGHRLPAGLPESDALPEPIVTPATKATEGHDLNITEAEAEALCGRERVRAAREAAIALYRFAAEHAEERGILSSPTRSSSSGSTRTGTVTLGDEALTPDSSRFWPADGYAPGGPQPSFDKQYVRDWCLATGWDRTAPGPALPEDVVAGTRARYVEAFELLTEIAFDALPRRSGGRAVRLTVLIRPKAGILDPQGEAVQASLATLGFSVTSARVGRLVDLEVDADDPATARAEVERMCGELLANPLIESFEIVEEAE